MNQHGTYMPAFVALILLLLNIPAARSGQEVTLSDVLGRTRAANPLLTAAELSGEVETARRQQAGQRINPDLSLEWEDLAGNGALSGIGSSAWTVGLSQTFELGGKRGRRTDLAERKVMTAYAARDLQWSDLQLQVTEAYITAWTVQARAGLQAELVDLSRQLVAQEEFRMRAGASSTAMLSRARSGLASAQATLTRLEGQHRAACSRLAAFWDAREAEGFLLADLPAEPETRPNDPDPDVLLSAGPDLQMWRAAEAQQQAALELTRSSAKPDLSLGLGLRKYNDTGDAALVVGAGLPLTLFDRKRGAIEAVRGELEMLRQRSHAAATGRYAALVAAMQERRIAWDEQRSLREEILPEALSAYQAIEAGFSEGRFSLIEVLETRRFLFELRDDLIDARAEYHLSDARITRYVDNDGAGLVPVDREVH